MSRRKRGVLSVALSLLLLWLPDAARAQSSQASLQGQVMNPASSEPIARALVIQRNVLTNTQGYRYTNEQGFFSFPALPPGTYTLRVDAMGFQPEERTMVELPVGGRVEMNVALTRSGQAPLQSSSAAAPRLGENPRNILAIMYGADAAVPQAVLIRLPVSQVETVLGSISSLIDENKILELPLAGRDVYTLLVLQPDVSSDNATARGLGFSVNGQQSGSSNFLLDGVDNNDLQVTGPAAKVSADAVKEYRMNTNNFTAEFGRNSGFIANAITRSGTNRFHGSLFEFFNHDHLNANSFANNWQDLPKEKSDLNQYGGTLGGPVVPDRLFFFGGFEQLRSYSESPPQTLFLPSAELIALAPANSKAKQLFNRFPPPAGQTLPGIFYAVQHDLRFPFPQVISIVLGRGDYSSSDGRQRLSTRYAFSQNTYDDFSLGPYPGFEAPLILRGQNLSVNYTRELFAGTNELKFGLSRSSVKLPQANPEISGLTSLDLLQLPGNPTQFDYFFRDTVFHVVDNYSRMSGAHALVLGFEWRPYLHDSLLSTGAAGNYVFGSSFDFLLDNPFLLQVTVNRRTGLPPQESEFWRYYFQNEMAGFLQDNWKLTRRLTLNLGLRWEYFGAPSARNGTQEFNFVLGPAADPYQRVAAGAMQSGPLFQPDRNNFAPRFGFAYDLTGSGRSVLRGGYGVFFDRIFNNFWMDTRSNDLVFGALANLSSQAPSFRYTFPARDGVLKPSFTQPGITVAVDPGLRTPYSQNWFIGMQQQLSPNLVLEINQTGALGRKLGATDKINRIFRFPSPQDPSPITRPNGNQQDISYRSNQGASNRVAVQMSLNRRWSQGMQFQASYTFARTRDVQSDPFARGTTVSFIDRLKRLADTLGGSRAGFTRQFDPSSDYGHADFDQRQNLVFSFVGQMPPVVGLPNFFSRWQVAALVALRSGFPFSVLTSQPPVGAPFPLYIEPGRGALEHNRASYWGTDPSDAFLADSVDIPGGLVVLDSSKFSKPAVDRIGNMPRNAFRGPGFWSADLSFSRGFVLPRLGERASLQLRVELFNIFNHTNLSPPEPVFDSISFGEAYFGRVGFASASPGASPLGDQPRRIQIAAKVYF